MTVKIPVGGVCIVPLNDQTRIHGLLKIPVTIRCHTSVKMLTAHPKRKSRSRVSSTQQLAPCTESGQVLYDVRDEGDVDGDVDDAAGYSEYIKVSDTHSHGNGSGRPDEEWNWGDPPTTAVAAGADNEGSNVDNKTGDEYLAGEPRRSEEDVDYLREFPFEDMSPNHPVDSLLDGR